MTLEIIAAAIGAGWAVTLVLFARVIEVQDAHLGLIKSLITRINDLEKRNGK